MIKNIPKYKSHKIMGALKIREVESPPTGLGTLIFEDNRYEPYPVSFHYMEKHKPKAGGYYVVYAGGYESWSPGNIFEEGNTLINENPDS